MTTLTDNINITEELGRIKTTIKRVIEDYDSLRQECMDRHIKHSNTIQILLDNMEDLEDNLDNRMEKLEDNMNDIDYNLDKRMKKLEDNMEELL